MKSGFLDKLIERLGRIGPEDVQNYLLQLAQEKGLIETVFNAIQEGIIVTDAKGRITYVNDAACDLFGFEAESSIGKRLDERVRGLDWNSLSQSEGAVSRDMEIFYPANRFLNFYIVPLFDRGRTTKADKEAGIARDHPPPEPSRWDTRLFCATSPRAGARPKRRSSRNDLMR